MPADELDGGDRPRVQRYDSLDGLRGIAAIAIVWLHVTSVCGIYAIPPNAFMAVDFFFCLSGFVIAHVSGNTIRGLSDGVRFMGRRARRLMPMAVIGAFLGCLCALIIVSARVDPAMGGPPWAAVVLAALLNAALLPSSQLLPLFPEAYSINPPLWSLAQEMLASLAIALGLARVRTSVLALITGLAACATIRISLGFDTLDFGSVPSSVWYGPIRVAFPFLCGVWLQRLPIERHRFGWVAMPALACVLFWPIKDVVYQIVSTLLLFPAIIVVGAAARLPHQGARICRQLGALSFPLYAVHFPIVRLMAFIADAYQLHNQLILASACIVSSGLMTAVVMWSLAPDHKVRRSPDAVAIANPANCNRVEMLTPPWLSMIALDGFSVLSPPKTHRNSPRQRVRERN